MTKTNPGKLALAIFCLLLVLGSGAVFVARVTGTFQTPRSYDLFVFAHGSTDFWYKGEMYRRGPDLADLYQPGAAVFKFPPAYQLPLAPWLTGGIPEAFFTVHRCVTLGCYLVAVAWLAVLLARYWPGIGTPAQRYILVALVILHAGTSAGFASAFQLQTAEIPLLLCLVLALAALTRYPALSGAAIAVAAQYKLYPAFLALQGIALPGRWRWLGGFAITSLLVLGAAWVAFGAQENLFYFTQVLPVLLQESLVSHTENVSLGALLLNHGFSLEQARPLVELTKLVVVASTLATLMALRGYTALTQARLLAFLVTGMLLCLSNYWMQYWVLLLVPILVISADYLQARQWIRLALLTLAVLAINVRPEWMSPIALLTVDTSALDLNAIGQEIATTGISTTLWHYTKPAWLFYWYAELRMLVPLLLWVILGFHLWQDWQGNRLKPPPAAATSH